MGLLTIDWPPKPQTSEHPCTSGNELSALHNRYQLAQVTSQGVGQKHFCKLVRCVKQGAAWGLKKLKLAQCNCISSWDKGHRDVGRSKSTCLNQLIVSAKAHRQSSSFGTAPFSTLDQGSCVLQALEANAADFQYFKAIQFVKRVKKGPLQETSPLLNDISGVATWEKVGILGSLTHHPMNHFPEPLCQ